MKYEIRQKLDELLNYKDKPIGVFGARASGKTMFFTSLFGISISEEENVLKIKCNDTTTKEYLRGNYNPLLKGELAPRTEANDMYKVNITYFSEGNEYTIKSIDFAGELIGEIPFNVEKDKNMMNYFLKKQEQVFSFFRICGGILIFLEPTEDIEVARLRKNEINKLISILQSEKIKWNSMAIGIVITKWDTQNKELEKSNIENEEKRAVEYIKNHDVYKGIYETLELFSSELSIFPVSAFIFDEDGKIKIDKTHKFFNVHKPLEWISNRNNIIWKEKILNILQQRIPKKDIEQIISLYMLCVGDSTLKLNVKNHYNAYKKMIKLQNIMFFSISGIIILITAIILAKIFL